MYKSYGNKNTNLDEVNLNISNSNMFAIMLEQSDGTYKEDTTNTWPTSGYAYNESMSGCVDINGNKLDGVLSYDATNNIATVDTGNTSYCYLYFKIKQNLGEYLLKNPSNGLVTTSLQGGMYRYKGVTGEVDNYICFGTSEKNDCINNTGIYMHRIIGINNNKQLKIIKDEALNEEVSWGESSMTDDSTWPDSLIYKYINDTENTSNYLNNEIYMPVEWRSKIATYSWKYGVLSETYDLMEPNALEIYNVENRWTLSISAKIGLVYIHDFLYSNDDINNSWLVKSPYYWTMTRSDNDMLYSAWYIPSDGVISTFGVGTTTPVYPTFYLNNDAEYVSGTGTISDPYIIN
ncbi:MAG: hypothetical protein IJY87_05885 [Bacilli bacterium]|nr:hypothetical protein [Bacilli bacterium]